MDNPNPIYYKDLITPDDSITKLIAQLEQLIGVYGEAKQKIQGAAAETAKSMQQMSGATEEQRKEIQASTAMTDKLLASYKELDNELINAKKAQAQATAANREAAQIAKYLEQINRSAEGSYNQLYAKYMLNKMALNEMSAAERAGTEAGRQLEAETAELMRQMNELQKATGKYTLQVGNYELAGKSLRTEMRELTQQMMQLKINGQQDSEEYKNMAQRAGELRDAMADVNREVGAMASDTQQLDATMGAASAASGGMAAMTGSMALMGQQSETASEAQKNLGATIGIVSGLTAVQSQLQKESNLMTGIGIIQKKAMAKAEAIDTAAKSKNIVATAGATAAQKLFNLVAMANPYVLLAIALVTVVGALVAFAAAANHAAKEQIKMNKATAAQLDYLEEYSKEQTRANTEREKALQDELAIAKARNAGLESTRKLEDEIMNERVKAHDRQMEIYSEQVEGLEANRSKLDTLRQTLLDLQKAQAEGKNKIMVDVDLDGEMERTKVDKAIDAVQGQIDNLEKSVDIAVGLKTEGEDISRDLAVQIANRIKENEQIAKTELDIVRQTQDARTALIADGYKRDAAQLKAASDRQIEDISKRLQTEKDLTLKARKALYDQIDAIEEKYQRDLTALRNQYAAVDLAARRETEDIMLELMDEGSAKQREKLRVGYEREVEDLQTALATRTDLTEAQTAEMYRQLELLGEKYRKDLRELEAGITADQLSADATRIQLRLDAVQEGSQEQIDLQIELLNKQREIELAQNRQLAEEVRQSEADINAKWDAKILQQTAKMQNDRAMMLFDMRQEQAATEFALLDKNERQRTEFQLSQERERLQKILELDDAAAVKMTDEQRKSIENTIKSIDKERQRLPYDNMYELLGLSVDKDQQDALSTSLDAAKSAIDGLVDSWVAAADAAVEAANKQVESAQRVLDAEIEARNAGYANEVTAAQKELDLAKKNQEKALKDQEKAQKAKQRIDSITQASSLVTASANIWSSFSGLGPFGVAAAIAAIATMWISFAASKIKAAQVTKQQTEQYGEGTVELLQGGSHASGHDIDLGTKPDGTRRRAEGGEFFAVINKRNSRRYRNVIPDVINSLNDGTFADRYQKANEAMAGYAVQMMGGTDVSSLEHDVAAIRQQGEERRYVDALGNTVIVYKNLTRRIR